MGEDDFPVVWVLSGCVPLLSSAVARFVSFLGSQDKGAREVVAGGIAAAVFLGGFQKAFGYGGVGFAVEIEVADDVVFADKVPRTDVDEHKVSPLTDWYG